MLLQAPIKRECHQPGIRSILFSTIEVQKQLSSRFCIGNYKLSKIFYNKSLNSAPPPLTYSSCHFL